MLARLKAWKKMGLSLEICQIRGNKLNARIRAKIRIFVGSPRDVADVSQLRHFWDMEAVSMPPSEDELRQLTDTDLDKVETFSKAKKTPVLVVFFDDMKGSSVLKQQMTVLSDEDAFQDLRREHDELLIQVITRDGVGEVIKSTGDGLLAVFTEPSVAVERALEIQEKLYRHPYLRVRIGLDMGQVRSEAAGGVQRDLFGRHVDWAARAESLADGGHILVTRSVYTDAFGWIPKPRVSWKEQGYYVVKDGEPAIEVFEPYNGNITGPLERLHGKKVSDSWQHRAEIEDINPIE